MLSQVLLASYGAGGAAGTKAGQGVGLEQNWVVERCWILPSPCAWGVALCPEVALENHMDSYIPAMGHGAAHGAGGSALQGSWIKHRKFWIISQKQK